MKLITDLALQKIEACIDNADGWISALKMSTQQRIQGLRELSIRMLSGGLNSLQKIELATECCVQPWLLEGYTELVTRHEVMSVEDEEQLGWTRTSNLFRRAASLPRGDDVSKRYRIGHPHHLRKGI